MARAQKFNQEKFFKKSALPKKEVPIAFLSASAAKAAAS